MKKKNMSTMDEGRIGSAVRLDELPPQYRKYPVLGRGATTIALAKDDKTALLFTRDYMKVDWLRHGIHMVSHSEVINPVRSHHIRGMQELDIYMLVVPRLQKLSGKNIRIVSREIADYTKILRKHQKEIGYGFNKKHQVIIAIAAEYEEQHPNSLLAPLFSWIMDYDPNQYHLDLGRRQFLQTADGKIVLVDPIVSAELMDLFYN